MGFMIRVFIWDIPIRYKGSIRVTVRITIRGIVGAQYRGLNNYQYVLV